MQDPDDSIYGLGPCYHNEFYNPMIINAKFYIDEVVRIALKFSEDHELEGANSQFDLCVLLGALARTAFTSGYETGNSARLPEIQELRQTIKGMRSRLQQITYNNRNDESNTMKEVKTLIKDLEDPCDNLENDYMRGFGR